MRCIYKTGGDANVCLSNRAEQFRMGQGLRNKGVTYKISAPEYDVPTNKGRSREESHGGDRREIMYRIFNPC